LIRFERSFQVHRPRVAISDDGQSKRRTGCAAGRGWRLATARAASSGSESRGSPPTQSASRVRMKHPRALRLPALVRPSRATASLFGFGLRIAGGSCPGCCAFIRIAVGAAARQPLHAPARLSLPHTSSLHALDCVCIRSTRAEIACREIPSRCSSVSFPRAVTTATPNYLIQSHHAHRSLSRQSGCGGSWTGMANGHSRGMASHAHATR